MLACGSMPGADQATAILQKLGFLGGSSTEVSQPPVNPKPSTSPMSQREGISPAQASTARDTTFSVAALTAKKAASGVTGAQRVLPAYDEGLPLPPTSTKRPFETTRPATTAAPLSTSSTCQSVGGSQYSFDVDSDSDDEEEVPPKKVKIDISDSMATDKVATTPAPALQTSKVSVPPKEDSDKAEIRSVEPRTIDQTNPRPAKLAALEKTSKTPETRTVESKPVAGGPSHLLPKSQPPRQTAQTNDTPAERTTDETMVSKPDSERPKPPNGSVEQQVAIMKERALLSLS